MIRLHPMADADFAWLLGEQASRSDGLMLCEGGIAPGGVTAMLRGIAARLAADTVKPVAWLVCDDITVIGMISFTNRMPDGQYELGYGVAEAYRGSGVMTRAIAALLPVARADGYHGLTAATSVDNPASQRVLEKNGFVTTGARDDPEDGPLVLWSLSLADSERMP